MKKRKTPGPDKWIKEWSSDMQLGPLYQLARLQQDNRAGAMHICVYTALLHLWHRNYYRVPFAITRKQVMLLAKIRSKVTYHKVMDELNMFGYISYYPSFHPLRGSIIFFNLTDDLD
ncbi:hypothetical protein [Foetidibacter luteolus]|uniref:hypothetical protein n=1 Tax=Foetidibacter luteolus TaxID=2608880 RepID=UPI00129A2BF4|nr:hypothetical protein [Foetidibacter luteolus]